MCIVDVLLLPLGRCQTREVEVGRENSTGDNPLTACATHLGFKCHCIHKILPFLNTRGLSRTQSARSKWLYSTPLTPAKTQSKLKLPNLTNVLSKQDIIITEAIRRGGRELAGELDGDLHKRVIFELADQFRFLR